MSNRVNTIKTLLISTTVVDGCLEFKADIDPYHEKIVQQAIERYGEAWCIATLQRQGEYDRCEMSSSWKGARGVPHEHPRQSRLRRHSAGRMFTWKRYKRPVQKCSNSPASFPWFHTSAGIWRSEGMLEGQAYVLTCTVTKSGSCSKPAQTLSVLGGFSLHEIVLLSQPKMRL